MKIERRIISDNFPPFIIAELSANHNNNLSRMLKLIDEAKKAG
jgi:N-acetylneuraminate synthase